MASSYQVLHDTCYEYFTPVALSQQQLHLTPRTLPGQQVVLAHALQIQPPPSQRYERRDAFGNQVTYLEFCEPHERLQVSAQMLVQVSPAADPTRWATTPWEQVAAALEFARGQPLSAEQLAACRFRFGSEFGRIKSDFAAYAADCFGPGRPLLQAVEALNHKIHSEIRFEPGVTTVSTPVVEVLRGRRGVCQDLAHLMIACLRSLGLAARYVSGYLLTRPPAGQPRLIGADASHAWVAVWCPGGADTDWVAFDPTNDLWVSDQHVTLAWGRDFADVSPLRGIIHGGDAHQLRVAVTMSPHADSGA